MKKSLLNIALSSAISLTALSSFNAQATIVEFDTSLGKIQVNLFDETTPTTVENFLNYVNSNHYNNTIIHRVIDDFIIQGGEFTFDTEFPLTSKEDNGPIRNEPVWSNVSGTIAMAKIGGVVNSASNQWFFNINDNSANLDLQNGGFTVFGQVIGDGFDVLTAIANIPTCAYSTAITEMPFIRENGVACNEVDPISSANFVTINSITIIDNTIDSAVSLSPSLNTLLDSDGDGELNINDNDDDGDGVNDSEDLYPFDPTESVDSDGDGVPDNTDVFPNDASESRDFDNDGTGDNADLDDDNDGVNDTEDAFPFNASEQTDTDGDGYGDNSDEFINDSTEWRDLDKDGVGDNADACPTKATDQTDTDGDGYCDETQDQYPNDPNEYIDTDGDGIGDTADPDDDNDGVLDADDYSPKDPNVTKDPFAGGGGGSLSIFALFSLALLRVWRK